MVDKIKSANVADSGRDFGSYTVADVVHEAGPRSSLEPLRSIYLSSRVEECVTTTLVQIFQYRCCALRVRVLFRGEILTRRVFQAH